MINLSSSDVYAYPFFFEEGFSGLNSACFSMQEIEELKAEVQDGHSYDFNLKELLLLGDWACEHGKMTNGRGTFINLGVAQSFYREYERRLGSSFAEAWSEDRNTPMFFDDKYVRFYLNRFAENGDSFRRLKEQAGAPCGDSEDYVLGHFRDKSTLLVLDEHTVWVCKPERLNSDADWDLMLNLATLEWYTPNEAVRGFFDYYASNWYGGTLEFDEDFEGRNVLRVNNFINRAGEHFEGREWSKRRSDGSEIKANEIRFARMVNWLSEGRRDKFRETRELLELRGRILGHYFPEV